MVRAPGSESQKPGGAGRRDMSRVTRASYPPPTAQRRIHSKVGGIRPRWPYRRPARGPSPCGPGSAGPVPGRRPAVRPPRPHPRRAAGHRRPRAAGPAPGSTTRRRCAGHRAARSAATASAPVGAAADAYATWHGTPPSASTGSARTVRPSRGPPRPACRPRPAPRRRAGAPGPDPGRADAAVETAAQRASSSGAVRPPTGPSTSVDRDRHPQPGRAGVHQRRRDVDPAVVGRRQQQRHQRRPLRAPAPPAPAASPPAAGRRGRGRQPHLPRRAGPRRTAAASAAVAARRPRVTAAVRHQHQRAGRGREPEPKGHTCRPHSVLSNIAQRPARGSSPALVRRVHGQQPIEP